MQTLEVDLGDRSYPIHIGQNLLSRVDLMKPGIRGSQVMIVSNETIAPLYLPILEQALSESYQVDSVILPDGEAYKDLTHLNLIFDALLKHKHNRTTTLIALGGGVVGDMTGFAAASYQRGVDFIQIPTTLLSQVDSSVGGKTGVNHAMGKNMIGAFHQPTVVLIDTSVLSSLPERELSAGLAEVIKYGYIWDQEFLAWLVANMAALMAKDSEALTHAIRRSCEVKAEVVAADETEQNLRAILNFGHTFGHAIETELGYGAWLHGEAVATGMLLALDLSVREGSVDQAELAKLTQLLQAADLPTKVPASLGVEAFLKHMAVDKKVVDKKLRLVLLESIGRAVTTSEFSHDNLRQTLIDASYRQ